MEFGDVFKQLERKLKRTRVSQAKRIQAQKLADEFFGAQSEYIQIASVKTGVVVIETTSSALFQEIEGFKRQALKEHLRNGGMEVGEIRAKLVSGF